MNSRRGSRKIPPSSSWWASRGKREYWLIADGEESRKRDLRGQITTGYIGRVVSLHDLPEDRRARQPFYDLLLSPIPDSLSPTIRAWFIQIARPQRERFKSRSPSPGGGCLRRDGYRFCQERDIYIYIPFSRERMCSSGLRLQGKITEGFRRIGIFLAIIYSWAWLIALYRKIFTNATKFFVAFPLLFYTIRQWKDGSFAKNKVLEEYADVRDE